jgi:hypothetical protein
MLSNEMRRAMVAVPFASLSAVRRPLGPSSVGPYRLPRELEERLTAALRDFRNRDAALALAVFLARYWSSEKRLVIAFPIDRRALTDHPALGLTEARVRGAIAALEAVGFLDRDLPPKGSNYRATEAGLRRKPVMWRFGSEYGVMFAKANARSRAARGTSTSTRRPTGPAAPTGARPEIIQPQVAQKESSPGKGVIMGDRVAPPEPTSGLEAALARLGLAVCEGKDGTG